MEGSRRRCASVSVISVLATSFLLSFFWVALIYGSFLLRTPPPLDNYPAIPTCLVQYNVRCVLCGEPPHAPHARGPSRALVFLSPTRRYSNKRYKNKAGGAAFLSRSVLFLLPVARSVSPSPPLLFSRPIPYRLVPSRPEPFSKWILEVRFHLALLLQIPTLSIGYEPGKIHPLTE